MSREPKATEPAPDTKVEASIEAAQVSVEALELAEPPLDLEVPAQLDAAWVAAALPSGAVTREAMQDAGWDALPEQVQEEALEILDAQEP